MATVASGVGVGVGSGLGIGFGDGVGSGDGSGVDVSSGVGIYIHRYIVSYQVCFFDLLKDTGIVCPACACGTLKVNVIPPSSVFVPSIMEDFRRSSLEPR